MLSWCVLLGYGGVGIGILAWRDFVVVAVVEVGCAVSMSQAGVSLCTLCGKELWRRVQ